MKKILLLILMTSCTQKYVDYDLIRKADFDKESYSRPVTLVDVLAQGRDELKSCFNQWLFFSNAEKNKERAIPLIVKSLCPGKDFLVNTEMTETWWTTIVFTRSCVDVKTLCGETNKIRK
jgi:hypothetical protein